MSNKVSSASAVQLPSLPSLDEVQKRLAQVLPQEVTGLPILTGPITARVVWTALFCGAIDHARHLRPTMVCWMRDSIAGNTSETTRNLYWASASRNQRAFEEAFPSVVGEQSWYRDNTREVIRDDVLRNGLWSVGAVLRDESQPTNSSKPVWTLQSAFAQLFSPSLKDRKLSELIKTWQEANLTEVMSGRLRAAQADHTSQHEVIVTLPDGGKRRLGAGTSSLIAKGVVENLAPRIMTRPELVSLSEGREHISETDAAALQRLGLNLTGDRLLPDVVFLDSKSNVLWCVEVVATDGPIHEARKKDLIEWAKVAGYEEKNVRFITAFESRTAQAFRARVATVARGTAIWFLDEPQLLVQLVSV